jgi:hypothetical protein
VSLVREETFFLMESDEKQAVNALEGRLNSLSIDDGEKY